MNGIPQKVDRYELKGKIGSGGMGVIYRGFDTRLKRDVAIKIISDRVKDEDIRKNIRDRFFNEARAAAVLSHPNIVQVYDFGETEELTYIVMELVEGETLEELLKSHTTLNVDQLLRLGKEVAGGLSFAHRKGIVHRDIKPSNIILEAHTGVAKILDFGIAKFVDEAEMKLTSTGMVLGSTHYLSPEHIIGKNLMGQSDIFCLGTLLYEAATGILPFRGTNSSSILYKIVHFDPQPVQELRPELPERLSALITRCHAKDPQKRWAKGEDLVKEIDEILFEFHSHKHQTTGKSNRPPATAFRSHFVRDSQLLSLLQAQNRLTSDQIRHLSQEKNISEAIFRHQFLTEDELAKAVGDCLDLAAIPRGRLKSIKIQEEALRLIPGETLLKWNILPFFLDRDKKILSAVIDGFQDFLRDPSVQELLTNYQMQFYISPAAPLHKLLEIRLQTPISATGSLSRSRNLTDSQMLKRTTGSHFLSEKRILIVEVETHLQEAMTRLFKRNENTLVLVTSLHAAQDKMKRESFDHIWANRSLIGDELSFEMEALKQNPSSEIRFYDSLAMELFQESVTYRRVREFMNKLLKKLMVGGNKEARERAAHFAAMADRLAKQQTESERLRDEVHFSALLWKWDQLIGSAGKIVDFFDGIFRLRYAHECIQERYDGRGPKSLREHQIPLASRVLTLLVFTEQSSAAIAAPEGTPEAFAELRAKLEGQSGKFLDPVLVASFLDIIQPKQKKSKEINIAIVDSDPKYAESLAAQLKRFAATTIYSDGLSAYDGFRKNKPDLIISEILLSKLDGFSLAARLRTDEGLKEIPFVFVSESETPEHSTKAIQVGADDFISKSAEPRFIVAKIERLSQRRKI